MTAIVARLRSLEGTLAKNPGVLRGCAHHGPQKRERCQSTFFSIWGCCCWTRYLFSRSGQPFQSAVSQREFAR
jgi:hypothetical protein